MKQGWRNIAWAAGTAALLILLLRGCVVTSYLIPSSGMENTLYQGERIFVDRWSYGFRLPLMNVIGYHRWFSHRVKQGDIFVFNNPADLTESCINRRPSFIGRCLGGPGDTLLVDSLFAVTTMIQNAPDRKYLYSYPLQKEQALDSLLQRLHITPSPLLGQDGNRRVRSFSRYEYYLIGQAMGADSWLTPAEEGGEGNGRHRLIIPGRDRTVSVEPWNRTLLCNTLVMHEHRNAFISRDTLFVDGKPVQTCRFSKDYYWAGTNSVISFSDSRLFGLVPEDHIIGRASRIWFSKESGSGFFNGYRWERIGSHIH